MLETITCFSKFEKNEFALCICLDICCAFIIQMSTITLLKNIFFKVMLQQYLEKYGFTNNNNNITDALL